MPPEICNRIQIPENQHLEALMPLAHFPMELYITDSVFRGGMNLNCLTTTPDMEEWFIMRTRLDHASQWHTLTSITEEYLNLGLYDYQGGYQVRSPRSQAEFSQYLANNNLMVANSMLLGHMLLVQYIQGVPLDRYLAGGSQGIIPQVLLGLLAAHEQCIIYGDRWVKNSIIAPNGEHNPQVVEVDFDIELTGPYKTIASFELAQTLYHIIHFSTSLENRLTAIEMITNLMSNLDWINSPYDQELVARFVSNHHHLFANQLYEGIPTAGDEILTLLKILNN